MKGYKLVKRNTTTVQMVQALSKHATWRAESPETDEWYACSAGVDKSEVKLTNNSPIRDDGSGWLPLRQDWRIYRPKRKCVKLGVFTKLSENIPPLYCKKLEDGKRYEVVVREVVE